MILVCHDSVLCRLCFLQTPDYCWVLWALFYFSSSSSQWGALSRRIWAYGSIRVLTTPLPSRADGWMLKLKQNEQLESVKGWNFVAIKVPKLRKTEMLGENWFISSFLLWCERLLLPCVSCVVLLFHSFFSPSLAFHSGFSGVSVQHTAFPDESWF